MQHSAARDGSVSVPSGTGAMLELVNVLVVEDDSLLGDALRRALEGADHTARHVGSAEDAWLALDVQDCELAIVDIGLPGQSGLEFVSEVRRIGKTFPILMATARCSADDCRSALSAGADAFVSKPFRVTDLIDRCELLLSHEANSSSPALTMIGGLVVDFRAREVLLPTLASPLTVDEWRVLHHLVQRAGKVVSRASMAEVLDRDPETIDGVVLNLRALLAGALSLRIVRGLGYCLAGFRS